MDVEIENEGDFEQHYDRIKSLVLRKMKDKMGSKDKEERNEEEIELQFGLLEEKLDEETNLEEMEDEDFTDDKLRKRVLNSLDSGIEKLYELHDNGETNGDISPDTFFLDIEEEDCKLIDFGMASTEEIAVKGKPAFNQEIFLKNQVWGSTQKIDEYNSNEIDSEEIAVEEGVDDGDECYRVERYQEKDRILSRSTFEKIKKAKDTRGAMLSIFNSLVVEGFEEDIPEMSPGIEVDHEDFGGMFGMKESFNGEELKSKQEAILDYLDDDSDIGNFFKAIFSFSSAEEIANKTPEIDTAWESVRNFIEELSQDESKREALEELMDHLSKKGDQEASDLFKDLSSESGTSDGYKKLTKEGKELLDKITS